MRAQKKKKKKENAKLKSQTQIIPIQTDTRKDAYSFFNHVVYSAGEGSRILFQQDPWSGPTSLKELYPELFVCAVVQESLISDMILYAPDGEVGVGTYFSVMILMTGKRGDFTLF